MKRLTKWLYLAGVTVAVVGMQSCGAGVSPMSLKQSVVRIDSQKYFFGLPPKGVGTVHSVGSGTVIGRDPRLGMIIATNAHVIRRAAKIRVSTETGEKSSAVTLLKLDTKYDLAILGVNGLPDARPLDVDSEDVVKRGEKVRCIGYTMGIGQAYYEGIVNMVQDKGRRIFHTCRLAGGASGGSLLDWQGRVIGINEAVIKSPEGAAFSVAIGAIRLGSLRSGKVGRMVGMNLTDFYSPTNKNLSRLLAKSTKIISRTICLDPHKVQAIPMAQLQEDHDFVFSIQARGELAVLNIDVNKRKVFGNAVSLDNGESATAIETGMRNSPYVLVIANRGNRKACFDMSVRVFNW